MKRQQPQKGKGRKRDRRWHRGETEADQWDEIARGLPDLGTGAEASGEPTALHGKGRDNKGAAL